MNLSSAEWLARYADRLRRQWPHIPTADLEDAAKDLAADEALRPLSPEAAAVAWLRRGLLAE